MPGRQLACPYKIKNLLGKRQQTQSIGNSASRFGHLDRHLLLREVEAVHQPPVTARLLKRIQVFTLQIFNK